MGDEPFDEAAFDAWLAGAPDRRFLFDRMWRHVMGPTMDAALSTYSRRRHFRRAWVAGGLVGLLAVAGGYGARSSIELILAQPREYAAANATIREIGLEDGTRLTLAGGADVRVRYTRHVREVELIRGTIFAHVTHDEGRPFRIDAGDARATDVGTSFEISRKPSNIRVTVESGAVRFGSSGWFSKSIDLTADQAAILAGADLSRVADVNREDVARWRNEWVEYHDVPMKQVLADLESTSPLPIVIADRKLADLRVTGRIRLADPIKQINNLSIIHGFSVDKRDDAIILARN